MYSRYNTSPKCFQSQHLFEALHSHKEYNWKNKKFIEIRWNSMFYRWLSGSGIVPLAQSEQVSSPIRGWAELVAAFVPDKLPVIDDWSWKEEKFFFWFSIDCVVFSSLTENVVHCCRIARWRICYTTESVFWSFLFENRSKINDFTKIFWWISKRTWPGSHGRQSNDPPPWLTP